MELLEDKVLAQILRLVPREDELKLLRVCKRWYRLMDTTVGIRVTIGRVTDEYFQAEQTPDSIKILEKVGIRSLEMFCWINDSRDLPKLKHPDLLEFISFKNFISSRSFESILNGVKHLYEFQIDQTAIFHLQLEEIRFSLPCQVLHIIKNDYSEFSSNDAIHKKSDFETLNINAIHFFQNSFPGLKKIIVNLTILKHNYDCLTTELMNFLTKHSDVLVDLYVFLEEKKNWFWYGMDDPEYKVRPLFSEVLPIQPTQFKKLRRIHVVDRSESSKKALDWMGWAMKIPNLKTGPVDPKVKITSVNLRTPFFDRNEAVITRIFIRLSSKCKLQNKFDCLILKDCFQLTELVVRERGDGYGCRCGAHEEKKFSEGLLNADLLPKSIETLLISGLPITCKTCEVLCLQLPALEKLELADIAGSIGYGVPRDVAQKIIQQKKIKEFVIEIGKRMEQDASLEPLDQAYKVGNLPCRRIFGKLETNDEYKLVIKESTRGRRSRPSHI